MITTVLVPDGLYITSTRFAVYHKWKKIRQAKLLRFQPYEDFHGNIFMVHWEPVFIPYLYSAIVKNSRENFRDISSKTTKSTKIQPSKTFPIHGIPFHRHIAWKSNEYTTCASTIPFLFYRCQKNVGSYHTCCIISQCFQQYARK